MPITPNHLILLLTILFVITYGTMNDYKALNHNYNEVIFFDIELGDAMLIKTSDNRKIIIDGGEGDHLLAKLSSKLGFFERYIDIVIVSHPQSDHIGGLIELVRRYEIGEIWVSSLSFSSKELEELVRISITKNIPIKQINSNSDSILGNNTFIDILYPLPNGEGINHWNRDINNSSSIIKITLGKERKSILFTGDTGKEIENILIRQTPNLHVKTLKVPHHGSTTSSSTGFIRAVNPKLGIINADKNNKFGHPHQTVINRYNNLGIKTISTGENGDISIKIL